MMEQSDRKDQRILPSLDNCGRFDVVIATILGITTKKEVE
jgi:hypothetical protein